MTDTIEIKLPQDILRSVFVLFDSATRAAICSVSRDFMTAAVAVSRSLAVVPRVYKPDHNITLNELLVIIESGDYHAFVRNQRAIMYMKLDTIQEEFYLLDTAFKTCNIDMIVPILTKGTIEYAHLNRITAIDDVYDKIMSLIFRHGDMAIVPISPFIDINIDDYYILEACMNYVIEHRGQYYQDHIYYILNLIEGLEQFSADDLLTTACRAQATDDICNIFIKHGARYCSNSSCNGHKKLNRRSRKGVPGKRATSSAPTMI